MNAAKARRFVITTCLILLALSNICSINFILQTEGFRQAQASESDSKITETEKPQKKKSDRILI